MSTTRSTNFSESAAVAMTLVAADEHKIATQLFFETLDQSTTPFLEALRWCEFDKDGGFLRAGISDPSDQTTYLVWSPDNETFVEELSDTFSRGDGRAGYIERTLGEDEMRWLITHRPAGFAPSAGQTIKAMSIPQAVFAAIIKAQNQDAGLTAAELRVLFQRVSGTSLKEAASEDSVSIETKRAQIKAAASKLNARGQTDLIQLAMSQLVWLGYVADSGEREALDLGRFAQRFLPSDIRVSLWRSPTGRTVRLLEAGPKDGTLVIGAHGLLFPTLLADALPFLKEHGLRLVLPMRTGHLENRDLSTLSQQSTLLEDNLADFVAYARSAGRTVPLLVNSLGTVPGILACAQLGDVVCHLIILSPNLAGSEAKSDTFAGKLFASIRRIGERPGLFRYFFWHMRKFFATDTAVAAGMHKIFGTTEADRSVLEGQASALPPKTWFAEYYRASIVGIAEDFRVATGLWQKQFATLSMPITVFVGAQDPFITFDEFTALMAQKPDAQRHVLKNAGHLIGSSHAQEIWSLIADTVRA
ncbi:MAG: alpha/beta hydrolase [Pseudomonadota bacterium]